MAEYSAFILGLKEVNKMEIKLLRIFRDSELVVNQVRRACKTKHPRLMQYRHEVWRLFYNHFDVINLIYVPRE